MRSLITFLLLVTAVRAAPSGYEKTIVEEMTERYAFSALTAFLKQVVMDHPTFEEVSLAAAKIDMKWRFEKIDPPRRMRNGDWVIWDQKDEDEAFDLYYMVDATHSLNIGAKRLARDRFEFVRLSIEEWTSLK